MSLCRPDDTDLHFMAAYCCGATCAADYIDGWYAGLEEFESWKPARQNKLLGFIQTECLYVLKELKTPAAQLIRTLANRLGMMLPESNSSKVAETLVNISQSLRKPTMADIEE